MTKRHVPVPQSLLGIGKWAVRDNKTGEVRDAGATRAEAKALARGWNKGEGKR